MADQEVNWAVRSIVFQAQSVPGAKVVYCVVLIKTEKSSDATDLQ